MRYNERGCGLKSGATDTELAFEMITKMKSQRRLQKRQESRAKTIQRRSAPASQVCCRNASGLVRKSVIHMLARQIGELFRPEKVILFGSYAGGNPDAGSDVDLLVVMPAYDVTNQAIRIRRATNHPFPLDLIVRTPAYMCAGLEEGDWFVRELMERGKVLYEKGHGRMGAKS
jgi:hypothetical protein